jgi:hypothetical protein
MNMMDVYEFIRKTVPVARVVEGYSFHDNRPHAEMVDGFKVSIQASEMHYCTPRQSGLDFYSSVELGYPTEREEIIMPYAEDTDDPTNTVYGYVPIDIVDRMVTRHGGIKSA